MTKFVNTSTSHNNTGDPANKNTDAPVANPQKEGEQSADGHMANPESDDNATDLNEPITPGHADTDDQQKNDSA